MPTAASVNKRHGTLRITRDWCGAASVSNLPKRDVIGFGARPGCMSSWLGGTVDALAVIRVMLAQNTNCPEVTARFSRLQHLTFHII